MKTSLLLTAAVLCSASIVSAEQTSAPSDDPGRDSRALRARLYDTAGALGNEGFKLRDGVWTAKLGAGKPARLEVNLFAGNQYWFCAARQAPGGEPSILLRDPGGRLLETLNYAKEGVAAVGVTAPATGRYIVEVRPPDKGNGDMCFIYLFK